MLVIGAGTGQVLAGRPGSKQGRRPATDGDEVTTGDLDGARGRSRSGSDRSALSETRTQPFSVVVSPLRIPVRSRAGTIPV